MSKWHDTRERKRALVTLSERFDVSFFYEGNHPVVRFRPKGFRTVIAELRALPGAHVDDVLDIDNAIRALARLGPK